MDNKGSASFCIFLIFLLFLLPRTASGQNWTIMPSGTTSHLKCIWGSSGSDVLAGGEGGVVLHYDGTDWAAMDSGTTASLHGMWWGSSGSDVFAVGSDGAIIHYDGLGWEPMDSGTTNSLNGIWGSSRDDVFAVGSGGAIIHYDGVGWEPMDSGTTASLNGIWGSSGNDVFAAGNGGTILHYDGTFWQHMDSDTTENLYDVWGSPGGDLIAVGASGGITHFDGANWSASGYYNELCISNLYSIWGDSVEDIHVVGSCGNYTAHYNGTSWLPLFVNSVYGLHGVWGTSSSEVFAVGENGTILKPKPSIILKIGPGNSITSEWGDKVSVHARLSPLPQEPVIVLVASSDTTEGTVNKNSLAFDSNNYYVEQVVTITGVDDQERDYTKYYTVLFGPASSADPRYDGIVEVFETFNKDDENDPPQEPPPDDPIVGDLNFERIGCFITTFMAEASF